MTAAPAPELQRAWRQAIHDAGMRVTTQREALLAAVWRLRHATADSLVAELSRGDAALDCSTVYRGLDALERIGLVRHAHLGAGGPTYHIAIESPHLHLQCRSCGRVLSLPEQEAADFVERIRALTGFGADMTHAAIHGRCDRCAHAGDRTDEDQLP